MARSSAAGLTDCNTTGNPLDAEAKAALNLARETVLAAWRKTDEGKAEAASEAKNKAKRAGAKNNNLLDFLSGLS